MLSLKKEQVIAKWLLKLLAYTHFQWWWFVWAGYSIHLGCIMFIYLLLLLFFLFSSLCHTMFEFAVEILRVMVYGWNPVHLVQCHQVCLIFVWLLYCYNVMPTTMRSVTNSLFIHVCINCKAAALVLVLVPIKRFELQT